MDKEIFRSSVMGVINFLERYENSEGLLERLPSWNFVEWSMANSWVYDVNYPTNFLYCAMLDAAGKTFSCERILAKADKVRRKTIECSFNGELFVDHAVKKAEGNYVNEHHISEVCQYYAILFGGIDLDLPEYSALKSHILHDFKEFDAGEYTFCSKNAFIGLYMRMNTLMHMKAGQVLADNLEEFYSHMSRTTGTLWEYKDGQGSLDHGFASYVALTIPLADAALSAKN